MDYYLYWTSHYFVNSFIMKYLLQIVGILILLVFGARMFGFLDRLIKTDAVWLCFLFGGILVCMGGFWLEEYQSKPKNHY